MADVFLFLVGWHLDENGRLVERLLPLRDTNQATPFDPEQEAE